MQYRGSRTSSILMVISLCLVAFVMVGCGKEPEGLEKEVVRLQTEIGELTNKVAKLEAEKKDLGSELAKSHTDLRQANTRLMIVCIILSVAFFAAVGLLVIGVAVGSRARRDAEAARNEQDEQPEAC